MKEDFPEEDVNTLIPSLSFSSFQVYWEWDDRQKIKDMSVRNNCFIVYTSAGWGLQDKNEILEYLFNASVLSFDAKRKNQRKGRRIEASYSFHTFHLAIRHWENFHARDNLESKISSLLETVVAGFLAVEHALKLMFSDG